MVKSRYIKKYFGYDYSEFNHGSTGKKAKRNRRLGNHIIRSRQKKELKKEIEEYTEEKMDL